MSPHTGRDPRTGVGRAGQPARIPADQRLRGDVARQVADLRCRLREASLRADALLAAGYRCEAAAAVAEQRALVSGFERRLATALADVSVEREAERVLAAASAWHEARRALARGAVADGAARPAPHGAPRRA